VGREPAFKPSLKLMLSVSRGRRTSIKGGWTNEPEPEEPPFDPRVQDLAARAALAALDDPNAWWRSPVALGPIAHGPLKEALKGIRCPPTIRARCECGYRLVKWRLDPKRGSVFPDHKPNKATTPGWQGLAWIDQANKGKGRMTTGGAAHDGLATQNYKCPKCGRNVPVSAERRLKLFLGAMVAGRGETWI
jgi:hypothetical protein